MPDYDDRKKLLESLKNRLEALLSPKLITSFNEHNTSEGGREDGLLFCNLHVMDKLMISSFYFSVSLSLSLSVDAQRLVKVFTGMEREGRVKEYYIQCHKVY